LVHSLAEEYHVHRLEVFCKECELHGIVLSEKNIDLFKTSIEFLRIIVKYGKIQMQQHIVQKIFGFSDELHNTQQTQKFLGILNYVHKYVPRLSQKTAPIRQHLSSGWSLDATQAIQQLKIECQQLRVLKPPRYGQLILQTDASDDFWASILFEKVGGDEHICAYKSGESTPSQKK
jgi:hypothetical protein